MAVTRDWSEGVAVLLYCEASPNMYSTDEKMETPLHTAIRLGNVKAAEMMLGYRPNLKAVDGEGNSLLHLAAYTHKTSILYHLINQEQCLEILHSHNASGNSVLHAALDKSHNNVEEQKVVEILEILTKLGVDVNLENHRGQTALYLAVYLRLPKCAQHLLRHGANPLSITKKEQSLVHAACQNGCAVCLQLLLDTDRVSHLILKQDKKNLAPFHYAINSSSIDCCELLLNNGEHLTHVDSEGESRTSMLIEYLPTASHLLTKLFNSHINLSSQPHYDPNFCINFDYSRILTPANRDIQSSLIKDLSNSREQQLLQHPLIESYISVQWSKVKLFFYSNLITYILFLIVHTVYIVTVYQASCQFRKEMFKPGIFHILHAIIYLLILWPQVVSGIVQPRKCLTSWETLTKVTSLTASAIVVFAPLNLNSDTLRQEQTKSQQPVDNTCQNIIFQIQPFMRPIAAMSVFLGWVELMMLFGRLPTLGTNVLMFTRIAKSALKFIAAFSGLLIGFATSFLVLFYDDPHFGSFGRALVRTLMMMIGEVDYTSLVGQNTTFISFVLLVVFLFLVCILMANLLIGLAIDDISKLENIGAIERLSKQAAFIVSFEKLLRGIQKCGLLPSFFVKILTKHIKANSEVSVYINKKKSRKMKWVSYHITPNTIQQAREIAQAKLKGDGHSNEIDTKTLHKTMEVMKDKLDHHLSELVAFLKQESQPQCGKSIERE